MISKMTQTDAKRISAANNQGAGWPSKNDGMESGGGRQNNPPAPRR
ncbi:hypothetical protein ALP39_200148 [Pseudomonas marginalis pv. marginalis]|nr:hypothetical protein ALP39_200148 [Pseudomonas marginalis pv. marginalis]